MSCSYINFKAKKCLYRLANIPLAMAKDFQKLYSEVKAYVDKVTQASELGKAEVAAKEEAIKSLQEAKRVQEDALVFLDNVRKAFGQ